MKPEAQSAVHRAPGRTGLSPEKPEPYRGRATKKKKKLTGRLNLETSQGSTHTLSESLALSGAFQAQRQQVQVTSAS